MVIFDRHAATALRVIAKNGRSCVWRQLIDGSPIDSDKPWVKGEDTALDHEVKLVFFPNTGVNNLFLQSIAGTTINIGDDYALMGAVDFTPTTRAQIFDGSGTTLLRGVKSINQLSPNGEIILYTIQLTIA